MKFLKKIFSRIKGKESLNLGKFLAFFSFRFDGDNFLYVIDDPEDKSKYLFKITVEIVNDAANRKDLFFLGDAIAHELSYKFPKLGITRYSFYKYCNDLNLKMS